MEMSNEKFIELIKECTTMKEKEAIVEGILGKCSVWFNQDRLPIILRQGNKKACGGCTVYDITKCGLAIEDKTCKAIKI